MIGLLAPGQGAQTPGMYAPWLELPTVAERLGALADASGLDLLRLGTTADADEIKDTAVTQPLIVALGLAVAAELDLTQVNLVTAGHSVGELTAAAVAGVLTAHDAVALASRRGAAMAAACTQAATGMSAVLGGDPDEVLEALAARGLTPANRNGAGQVVAAGLLTALADLAANPPTGARVRPLPVAGAFHTEFMGSARAQLADADVATAQPEHLLLSNADGTVVADGRQALARLVDQVTRPVRWDLCQQTLASLGVTALIELPPAGTLAGLAKRELPGIKTLAVKTPADLAAARALLERPLEGEHTVDFGVVVAPAKGVFSPTAGLAEGAEIGTGASLGTIRTNRDEHEVLSNRAGVLLEWLRSAGDIVPAGLPVARIGS